MHRHLFNFTLSFITGIMLITNCVSTLWLKIILISAIIVCAVCGVFSKKAFPFVCLSGIIFGILLTSHCNNIHNDFYNTFKDLPVTGEIIVTKEPKHNDTYHSFYGKLVKANGTKLNRTVFVTYYGDKTVELNDIVIFDEGELLVHDENMNPGGFNYKNYYKSENAHFKITFDKFKVAGKGGRFPAKQARMLNMFIKERLSLVFSAENTKTFFTGLFLGDKTELTEDVEITFKNMGISHALAVSGMHVIILITFLGQLLLLLKLKTRTYNIILGIVLFMFCFLTGLEPSVIRASITAMLATFTLNKDTEYDSITALSFAALLMLIHNPYALYSISFQLSFMAAAGISVMSGKLAERLKFLPEHLTEILCTTFSATFATLPVIIKTYGYVSPLVFIGNLIIVPVLPLIYALGIISAVLNFYPLSYITDTLFTFILKLLAFFSDNMLWGVNVPVTSGIYLSLFVLVALTLYRFLNPAQNTVKTILTTCLVPFLIFAVDFVATDKNAFSVTFINAGQGDSALLSSKGEHILVDTSTEKNCNYEIIPYLKRKGIKKLDAIIISHFHDDHAGGIEKLSKEFEIEKIIIPDTTGENDLKSAVLSLDTSCQIAHRGDIIDFGDAEINVLKSEKEDCDENNSSLVFKLCYNNKTYLFMGDSEKEVENRLYDVDADILKVGHHGSNTGTTQSFLERVTPETAVISAGKNNRYNHPHSDVVARLKASGAKIHRTDRMGILELSEER